MDKKPIIVSKIGAEHSFQGKNRQDFGAIFQNNAGYTVKFSLDGCSSGHFSEVGVLLFAQAIKKRTDITAMTFKDIVYQEFRRLTGGLGFTDAELFENFCFTILAVVETEKEFVVFSCGDGYVFTITNEHELEVIDVDSGYDNFPPYFVYNLMNPENLSAYKEGVDFKVSFYSKEQYEDIGVGSDGYRFVENLNNADRVAFDAAMLASKGGKIGQIINRNAQVFKDDITVVL